MSTDATPNEAPVDDDPAERENTALRRPRACVRVGVVGHTKFAREGEPEDVGRARCREHVHAALTALSTATAQAARSAAGMYRGDDPPRVRLVSCLAPGFDRLAAHTWAELAAAAPEVNDGAHTATWLLSPDGETPADLTPESARHLRPSSVRFELTSEPGDDEAPKPNHEVSTRFLVNHSDVLLVYWNGERDRPRRSDRALSLTWLAVTLAAERGIPVLWISSRATPPPSGDSQLERLRGTALRVNPEAPQSPTWHAALSARIHELIAPFGAQAELPCPSAHADDDPGDAEGEAAKSHREQARRLARLLCEPAELSSPVTALPRLWSRFWSLFKAEHPAPGPFARSVSRAPTSLWEHYEAVDLRARSYADLHRGSLLALTLLGPLAVAASLLAFVLKIEHADTAALAVVVVELLAIGLMATTYVVGRKREWHERSVEYRSLAESLRQTAWTWSLGVPVRRAPETPFLARAKRHHDWAGWYHDALVREADPGETPAPDGHDDPREPRCFDAVRFRTAVQRARTHWISDQYHYYLRSGPRYHALHQRVSGLLSAAIIAAACAGLLSLVMIFVHFEECWAWTLKRLTVLLGVLGPAAAAALHSLASNLESERMSNNFGAMADDLKRRRQEFEASLAGEPELDITLWRQIEAQASSAARAMLDEVNDWHAATSNNPLVPI